MNRRSFTAMLAASPLGLWVASRFHLQATEPLKRDSLPCTRCGKSSPSILIARRPTGMTWFTPSSSDSQFPVDEKICGQCITDHELLRRREIGDVVLFVTGVLLRDMARYNTVDGTYLECTRAHFMTYNNETKEQSFARERQAALKAIGL